MHQSHRSVFLLALTLCAAVILTGCDARLMAAGHVFSLCASLGMIWGVLNMHRFKT